MSNLIVIGHINSSLEMNHNRVCTFTIDSLAQDKSNRYTIYLSGTQADAAMRYLRTGDLMCIEGKLKASSTTDILSKRATLLQANMG